MTATITKLPQPHLRTLAPIDIKMNPRTIALALGGTGEKVHGRDGVVTTPRPWFRCRCPLCDGPMRVADEVEGNGILIDCQKGCDPEAVVTNLIKRGFFVCWDARRRA